MTTSQWRRSQFLFRRVRRNTGITADDLEQQTVLRPLHRSSVRRHPSVFGLRHPSLRCCLGWSRSAGKAGCLDGSSSSCGTDAPASVWSWHPTSSAAWSRFPPPPLRHLYSSCCCPSVQLRTRMLRTWKMRRARQNVRSVCGHDVQSQRHLRCQVCSTNRLETYKNAEMVEMLEMLKN